MTYDEAVEDKTYTITKKQAMSVISRHHVSFDEFINEAGDHAFYKSSEVLIWLGY